MVDGRMNGAAPHTVDAPLAPALKTLRDLLRAARDERLIRCEQIDVYTDRREVPESIRDQLPADHGADDLHWVVARRLDRFAAEAVSPQLVKHAPDPKVIADVLARDLDCELNKPVP